MASSTLVGGIVWEGAEVDDQEVLLIYLFIQEKRITLKLCKYCQHS